jgi:hypothetical protein
MVVVSDPPRVALDAVSAAATPSIAPLTNFSVSLYERIAYSQQMRPTMSPTA